ncbi:methyltransferase domain-containing protein [Thermococcus sp.]|uniref:class I SAM-dependent methyltransferase n=1 Tax=Thermococcus sp. TaxID=35749 RepID=UPI00260FB11C|nr:methyltransferase domain-containing protein [Thermococcus sp.]
MSVEVVDANIEYMTHMAVLQIISLGTKHGVFSMLAREPSLQEFLDNTGLPNRALLVKFLSTLQQLGMVSIDRGRLRLNDFSYTLSVSGEAYRNLIPDWVSVHEEIYRMVDYAFITPVHPRILMDFDKDADFWDIRMNSSFSRTYRKVMAEVSGISSGMEVFDIGCGSVSPEYFGSLVGYNGFYMGIDYSPSMLDIARMRVEEKNLPVTLKEIDARLMRPINEYDVVLMSFVLEYISDRGKVLVKAVETLKEGGKLVILEPFRDTFPNIAALEFFESLNKDFRGFPSMEEVESVLKASELDVSMKRLGRSLLLVEKV